jgi:glycosyltransferase involved in cell wall biosynthesis
VLYVVGSLDSGGTEHQLLLLCKGLAGRGFRISVYTLAPGGELVPDMIAAGVNVIHPPFKSKKKQGHLHAGLRLAIPALQLLWLFVYRRPRIVHFLLPEAYVFGGILAGVAMLPRRVMGRRSLNDYQRRQHPQLARIETWLHRSMDVIVGNSRRVVRQLVEDEGVPEAKTRLIYNGIDLARFSRLRDRDVVRRALDLDADALVMAIVANLIPYKGHADLLAALGRVKSQLPEKWALLIVGRDNGIGSALAGQARELGIDRHVRFLGQRSDIPDLLGAADVGLLASHEEGFSNAILEKMAAGLPVIATDVGGNSEAIVEGVTGFLVPPRDPEALGVAIVKLCSDRALARRMGDAGRARVRQEFSIDRCIGRYEQLYGFLGLKPAAGAVPGRLRAG